MKFRREVRRENCWNVFDHERCDYNDYAWIDTECAENQMAAIPYVDTKSEISRRSGATTSGSLLFLDRQSIECPKNGFLSELTFESDWLHRFFYRYTCIEYDAERFACETIDSDYQYASDSMSNLDNRQLYCPAGKSMVSWNAIAQDNLLKFEAKCCKAIASSPTKLPTYSPMSEPIDPLLTYMLKSEPSDPHHGPEKSKALICTANFEKRNLLF